VSWLPRASARHRGFRAALSAPGIAVIAEHKRRSPSAGDLKAGEGLEVVEIVQAYERGGAAALSILTEPDHFAGSLDDLRQAREATGLPLLRKDFIIDPYQVHESRAAGADAILLIVAALDRSELASLHHQAHDLGLDVLVEVHDAPELEAAIEVGAELIGINNRDLTDFTVDLERTFELLSKIPPHKTIVSESGISSREQLDRLEAAGVDAALIGEAFMRNGLVGIEGLIQNSTGR
jgi:indole-3-glycerol phosphate synthase